MTNTKREPQTPLARWQRVDCMGCRWRWRDITVEQANDLFVAGLGNLVRMIPTPYTETTTAPRRPVNLSRRGGRSHNASDRGAVAIPPGVTQEHNGDRPSIRGAA